MFENICTKSFEFSSTFALQTIVVLIPHADEVFFSKIIPPFCSTYQQISIFFFQSILMVAMCLKLRLFVYTKYIDSPDTLRWNSKMTETHPIPILVYYVCGRFWVKNHTFSDFTISSKWWALNDIGWPRFYIYYIHCCVLMIPVNALDIGAIRMR